MNTITDKYSKHRTQIWEDLMSFATPQKAKDPERKITRLIFIAGAIYFMAAIGALIGFVVGYKLLRLKDKKVEPFLHGQPTIIYSLMVAGAVTAIIAPVILYMFFGIVYTVLGAGANRFVLVIAGWLLTNFFASYIAYRSFVTWQVSLLNYLNELKRYGTARFALPEETQSYKQEKGIYIGDGHYYEKSGHVLTVAGTRGGKGVNIIVPQFLKTGRFEGSWVVVDPKGEIAAITANAQRKMGRKVVILNPWELLKMQNVSYNPLDLLKMDLLNLSDDVQLISETIVPATAGGNDNHFDNRARAVISGLLLHLMTTETVKDADRTLGTLWSWLRLDSQKWNSLLIDMSQNKQPAAGDMVVSAAYEILSLMEKGEKEYASIISTAQKWTDFLKSPALRKSLSGSEEIRGKDFVISDPGAFKSSDLHDGNTTVYVVIPADRLKTHYQWLRLVVSSLMRSVIRRDITTKITDVGFLLDEFYALGYLSEIEIALGSYAGYGVHLFMILQNLVQLQDQYGSNWENFISSCAVRHFFNVSENFSAEYISKMFGEYSFPVYGAWGTETGVTPRPLVKIDELRMESSKYIFTMIDALHPAAFVKAPYFNMPELELGRDYDVNPYYRGK